MASPWLNIHLSAKGTTAKYLQISNAIAQVIRDGLIPAGEKLPTHRSLAAQLQVTTATINRAYAELERANLISARVGDGTYVHSTALPTTNNLGTHSDSSADFAQNVTMPTQEAAVLQQTLAAIAEEHGVCQQLLRYQSELGMPHHRAMWAQWLTRFALTGAPDRVMTVNGAQHALALILRTVTRPGDVIFSENLTYPGFGSLVRQLRLHVVGIASDAEGMLPDALEKSVRALGGKVVFCIPTLHTPTLVTMSRTRREQLAALVRKHELTLIEDGVQAALLPHPPPAVSSFAPAQSFFISSLSKSIGGGLRVGFIEGQPQALGKVAAALRADCWMASTLAAEVVYRWMRNGELERLCGLQRELVAQRQSIARAYLTDTSFRMEQDCPLLWLTLPETWRAGALAMALRQAHVFIKTSDSFAVGRTAAPHAIRINLSAASNETILKQGLGKIRTLLQEGAPELISA